jgi:hypothetical protein
MPVGERFDAAQHPIEMGTGLKLVTLGQQHRQLRHEFIQVAVETMLVVQGQTSLRRNQA